LEAVAAVDASEWHGNEICRGYSFSFVAGFNGWSGKLDRDRLNANDSDRDEWWMCRIFYDVAFRFRRYGAACLRFSQSIHAQAIGNGEIFIGFGRDGLRSLKTLTDPLFLRRLSQAPTVG
jgi:hypothetical protein